LFLVWSSLLTFAGVIWFFTPRFAIWMGLEVPAAHFNPEVNRAVWTLRQIDDPFMEIPGATNAPLRWRLAFPLLAHYLHLPAPVFLALPHVGALIAIATIVGLSLRETGSRAVALATGALMTTASWFFVSTGWLAYFDSWYVLGLLVLSFGSSTAGRVLACLLTPWVDERYILSIPICLTVRAAHRDQISGDRVERPWRDWLLCGAALLPYVALRAAAGDEVGLSAYIGNRMSKEYDLARCLAGIWGGLRMAWLFVAAYVWRSVVSARWLWKIATLVVVPSTAVGMLFVAGDYSRSMSMLLPAALLGVWCTFRERWRRRWQLLIGVLALNLLLPAQHVVGAFVSPIYYVYHEIERYRHPPPYLTGVAQYRSGLAREEAGDLSAAIAEYDTAIRLSPRGWAAYAQRGSAKAKRGEWREAAADYRRALELAPVDWPQRADLEERLRKAEQMASRVK
jgi:hypothetical protein